MKKTFDEMYKIQDNFMKEYSTLLENAGCGIAWIRGEAVKEKVDLKKVESLDDLCLAVRFTKKPRKDTELPSEYQGVRVFYKYVGEIKASGQ